jgi:hypothetical protein
MPDPIDFEDLYRRDPDPFAVASSWYERRKIDVVLAALAHPEYDVAWDCACGTGELAARLAARCTTVVATDASAEAVRLTARRTGSKPVVRCLVNRLPDVPDLPGAPSLVVVSEVLYYLDDHAREQTCAALARSASQEIVGVSWRHHPGDAHVSGADSVAELDDTLRSNGWHRTLTHDEPDFLLWAWQAGEVAPS